MSSQPTNGLADTLDDGDVALGPLDDTDARLDRTPSTADTGPLSRRPPRAPTPDARVIRRDHVTAGQTVCELAPRDADRRGPDADPPTGDRNGRPDG
jgi:hypothetical protein